MARPRKPHCERKNRSITFWLTETEFARFFALANKANLRVNDLVRVVALSRRDHVTIKTYAAYDPALLAQLHRIGVNLNQLTRYAHAGRLSGQIQRLCDQIEFMITEAAEKELDR